MRFPITRLGAFLAALPLFVTSSCSSEGQSPAGQTQPQSGNTTIRSVQFGRLVDVYGLRATATGLILELFQEDVLVGPDIQDERDSKSEKADHEILYDFISPNPETLQPRLLITRDIATSDFAEAYAALGQKLRQVSASRFGQDIGKYPFTVVPRNAAIRIELTEPPGVDDSFFVTRDQNGFITGLKNTEAVQMLEIVGDPNDAVHRGDFKVLPVRTIVRGKQLILDPVLLGNEGVQLLTRNNASGLPESPNQQGANIRLALDLEGILAIPGLNAPHNALTGTNNNGNSSLILDFRSGNKWDQSADIANGFLRESDTPHIVGSIPMRLAKVETVDKSRQLITLWKAGRSHELDRGDILSVIDPATNKPLGRAELNEDPKDDRGEPSKAYVGVIVRQIPGIEAIDPSKNPLYPTDPAKLDAFLAEHAPKVIVSAPFTASRAHPVTGEVYGDDPTNFVTFTPDPLPHFDGTPSAATENISPFAGAIVRFSKPIDRDSLSAADSFFFATRNVLDRQVIEQEFLQPNNIDPARFDWDKFITPHLVASRIIDEDGSQTAIRIQPTIGFFLNVEMRPPHEAAQFPFFVHLLGGLKGIHDFSGNQLDFGAEETVVDSLVIPFTLDTRNLPNGQPVFSDNIAISVVRRYASEDEDEQPSLYMQGEAPVIGAAETPMSRSLPDTFGAVTYLSDGTLTARTTARVTKAVDPFNQISPPTTPGLLFCPPTEVATPTAGTAFGSKVQNPLNPYGSRMQTVWREIDLSLSRLDPHDFNLDVEQMYWAPFTGDDVSYDELDRTSLFLGHAEYRPEPCVLSWSAFPSFPQSGLKRNFADNYAHNRNPATAAKEDDAAPHTAYTDQRFFIDPTKRVSDPTGKTSFLPLPKFEEPYFVWRDETSAAQGGNSSRGIDTQAGGNQHPGYIPSPGLGGQGRGVITSPLGGVTTAPSFFGNYGEASFTNPGRSEQLTGGGLTTIALPLMADFWTYCDDPALPTAYPFLATGFNGWQISLGVASASTPNFRAISGGFSGYGGKAPICIGRQDPDWTSARGGYKLDGTRSNALDNSIYWVMADFIKRQTVMTAGFVDIRNPHRMPTRTYNQSDPRLGPYFAGSTSIPTEMQPEFDWHFEPPLDQLPGGTSIVPEFRGASEVDSTPWRWAINSNQNWFTGGKPDAVNFPLDPRKAIDAGVRKFDDRLQNGTPRKHWAFYYNRQVTDYTRDINDLGSDSFANQFAGPGEPFAAHDMRYFNWRFTMKNNVQSQPAVSPTVDTFSITYRFQAR